MTGDKSDCADRALSASLCALTAMVEEARLAEVGAGCLWEFRGVHFGTGILAAVTKHDLLSAFLSHSQVCVGGCMYVYVNTCVPTYLSIYMHQR